MRRKTKTIIAITLAASMTLSSTVFSFADPYDGPYFDGETHDVDGGNETVVAGEENTVVNVNGDVTPEGDFGVQATDGAEINVNGNIESVNSPEGEAVVTDNDGKVTVTGDVTGNAFSIMCGHDFSEAPGGTVEVGGNANGTIAVYDGTVEVKGDVTGTENQSAIVTHGNSGVTVGGNVTSSSAGIETEGNSTIVIEKTLTASTSDPVILLDHSTYNEGTGFTNNPNAKESTIIVYEIKGNLNNLVKSGYSSGGFYDEGNNQYVEKTFIEDANDTLKNKQINNIFYIIKQSDGSSANINSITGSGYAMRSGYYSAPQDTALTISVKEGYGVKAGTIEVTKNADGTFTLVVPKGGGVTITAEAIQEAVKEAEENGKGEAKVDDNKDKSEKKPDVNPTKKSDNSKQDDDDDDDDDNNSNPAAIPQLSAGFTTAATLGNVTRTTVDPSSGNYSARVVELIANVPAGGTLNLDITSSAYLDTTIINALAARSDVSLNLTVNYLGVPFTLSIPAGYNLLALMGTDGKIDLAKLIETFPPKAK